MTEALTLFASKVGNGEGGGVLLKGAYGTGKSHLLAYLASRADIPRNHRRLLAVPVALNEWSSENCLEKIVTESAEETLGFHSDKQSRGNRWHELHRHLQTRSYSGFFILMDEVSAFLRSRPEGSELHEDLRFLQFLSEFLAEHSGFCVLAVQEEIDDIGASAREASTRIKDRYPLRWELDGAHFSEVLRQRMLPGKPGYEQAVNAILSEKLQLWLGEFNTTPDDFQNIYPLHPSTWKLMNRLGPLFSNRRGALRFVRDALSKNGMALDDRDANELITPNQLYECFRDRISESPSLKTYENKVRVHLSERAEQLLAPEDLVIAEKIIRCLLLFSLDPSREGASVKLLTSALDLVIGDATTAASYVEDRILTPLLASANHLRKEGDRYFVDPGLAPLDTLHKLYEARVRDFQLNSPRVWNHLMPLLRREAFRFSTIWAKPESLAPVRFMNTSRSLRLCWGISPEPADLHILLPDCDINSGETKPESLYWIPRSVKDTERQQLIDCAMAVEATLSPAETNAAGLNAKELLASMQSRTAGLIETLYRDGHFQIGPSVLKIPAEEMKKNGIESILEEPIFELFSLRYPRFREIAPRTDYYSERLLSETIGIFVDRGFAPAGELKNAGVLEIVTGVMMPMGIALPDGRNYRFFWNADNSPLVGLFEDILQKEGFLPAKNALLSAPFGLPAPLADFFIWAAITGAGYRAFRQGEEIPPGRLSFFSIETLEELRKNEDDDNALKTIAQNDFFENEELRGLSGRPLRKRILESFQKKLAKAERFLKDDFFPDGSHWGGFKEEYQNAREKLAPLVSVKDSREEEILRCMTDEQDKLSKASPAIEWLQAFAKRIQRQGDREARIYAYLNDSFFDTLPDDEQHERLNKRRKQCLEQRSTMVPDEWLTETESFIHDYREFYKLSHGTHCPRDLNRELENRPFCSCGFLPGARTGAVLRIASLKARWEGREWTKKELVENFQDFLNSVKDEPFKIQ